MAETSLEELEVLDLDRDIHRLSEQIDNLRAEQLEKQQRKDAILAGIAAEQKIANMSDAEKSATLRALQQSVGLAGVESQEAVAVPQRKTGGTP